MKGHSRPYAVFPKSSLKHKGSLLWVAEQKVAVITGASQGIGAALVKAYRDRNYRVVATARSISRRTMMTSSRSSGDIADRKTAERAISAGMARFGRIDTLVNNAGIFIAKPFTQYTEADYAAILGVNVAGFFHITQLAVAEMEKQGSGHVVQITTSLVDHAITAVPSVLASLTKGGLNAATKSLAIEYAKRGIRVNAVAPGVIKIADASRRDASAARPPASGRPHGRDLRHRRRDPLPRVGGLCDGRNPSRGRRPERGPLTQPRRGTRRSACGVDHNIFQQRANTMIHSKKCCTQPRPIPTGGRDGGASRSSDGHLEVKLSAPSVPRGSGTNPEQLFAAGWSACFISAMKLLAGKMKVTLPPDVTIDAEVDLGPTGGGYGLAARLNVSLPGVDHEVARAPGEGGARVVSVFARHTWQHRSRDQPGLSKIGPDRACSGIAARSVGSAATNR